MDADRFPSVNAAIAVKVVLLGYVAVGKTCLLNRYIYNHFKSDPPSTQGASYSCKVIFYENYHQNIKFDIWDTSGQEKYRSLNKLFYRDAKIAILVYDITSNQSFQELKNYWYSEVKNECPENMSKFN